MLCGFRPIAQKLILALSAPFVAVVVCPNCGGGFISRPIRVKIDWKSGNSLKNYPASKKIVYKKHSIKEHKHFFQKIKFILAEER